MRVLSFVFITLIASMAWSRGGGHSIGGGISIGSPSQGDLNGVIDDINSQQSASLSKLSGAYEFWGHYSYRFSGSMFALHFRPSYFTSSTDGGGREVSLKGFMLYPMLRLFPLENKFIKFFMQAGIGITSLDGKISTPSASASFSGSGFGVSGGLGADFCFTANHCVGVEGNVRYNPIVRNTLDSAVTGTASSIGLSQGTGELERNNKDIATSVSGVSGGLYYTFVF
jgi:hypothetical protein